MDKRSDGRWDGRMDNVKTVYPPTNTVCGGYNEYYASHSDNMFVVKIILVIEPNHEKP